MIAHVVELPCHLVESQHSLPLLFDLTESCCCHEVPRARLLSSSLVYPPFVAVSHLILGPAQEQRLVKRESLLAQASPTYNLSCRISHRSCLLYPIYPPSQSVSQSVSHSVNTALAHLRSFLPCAGHAIDNPQSAQASANVNSHALASHHPRPLPSPAHIHSDTHIAITWPQTTKTGRIDLYTQPTWSKTSTLRQATACCMLSLHAEPDD